MLTDTEKLTGFPSKPGVTRPVLRSFPVGENILSSIREATSDHQFAQT